MVKRLRIDSNVVKRLADKAAALRKSDGLEITAAVKQVLAQEKMSDNTAHYHAICSELGRRGAAVKRGVKIANVIRRSQHRTDQQKKEAQNMARERNDNLLPDP
ncbi:MAG: hypothetical protein HZC04_00775 [Candidatus Lloydbacteria bacterium]|nr:hypothetical protein [Candidatus Lloydbacteria bacterium]